MFYIGEGSMNPFYDNHPYRSESLLGNKILITIIRSIFANKT